jgi:GNAT superfamily N-acetyltransferase
MVEVRRAVPADAAELVRLRIVMFGPKVPESEHNGPWRAGAEEMFHGGLGASDPTLAAFVVDADGREGLAACAAGLIERRVGSPPNPTGLTGWIFNVATDHDHRRRGYARACVNALIDWYAGRGLNWVELRSSEMAESMYESFGFRRTSDPAMRLALSGR